jgi:hypothetical protein
MAEPFLDFVHPRYLHAALVLIGLALVAQAFARVRL